MGKTSATSGTQQLQPSHTATKTVVLDEPLEEFDEGKVRYLTDAEVEELEESVLNYDITNA